MKSLVFSFVLGFFALSAAIAQDSKMMRYPNTSLTELTFCYAGDVYIVPINGGIARKLTSSQGTEMYPRFSRDGRQIAFTGEYDGNREIYTIPTIGGEPKRLTYSMDMNDVSERQGPDKIIMGWTPDGNSVYYRSRMKSWNVLVGKLYSIDKVGGLPSEYALPKAGYASLSPDGKQIAYNRIFREYRTWKRYRGGQADDIWIYDFDTKQLQNITNHPSQDIMPMWYKNKVYFLSDRDHTMNLFCYDMTTKQTKKVTNFSEYDVKFPSLGAEHISFENGGNIFTLKLENDYMVMVPISIGDDKIYARTKYENVSDRINYFDLAPDGKRSVVSARGDIFTIPEEKGNILNLTKSSGVHERNPVWSPDGRWIAFISDESGEDEVYIIRPDGSDKTKLTNDAKSYRWELKWSPDSKKLLNSDKTMRLFYIDIETKKTSEIAKSKTWELRDFSWSPDSRWVAYTDFVGNYLSIIYLYSLETGKTTKVSSEFFESSEPIFSKDSKYLFFTSNRSFNPTIGNFEYNFTYNNMTKVYGITLQRETESPFAKYESDETKAIEEERKKEEADDDKSKSKKSKKEKDEDKSASFDLDGIEGRIFELPVPAANYFGLSSFDDKVYYVRTQAGNPPTLYEYSISKKEEVKIGAFASYTISADGKKIMFAQGKDYFITKLKDNISGKEGKLNLADMKMEINPKEEWKQIFEESWRQMKYFFYDPNMHGVDWKAIKEKYAKLLPYVAHRSDLTYILGEMIGELNVGHAYVGGGDLPKVESSNIGYLGCDFEFDAASGFYRIKKIYEGRNWEEKTRSPLTESGVKIKQGDFIISINGKLLSRELTPYAAMTNQANKFVTIKYNKTANANGASEQTIKTIASESDLRYFNWVENNRRYVDSVTQGRVAYIHIPDMSPTNGLNEFVKYFYPQARKEALIIDDRYNGGGNVSPMVIERLRRILAVAKNARNQELVFTTPDAIMTGPMVCLINEQSMSDGDLFPYQFKSMGLGKLIGKRSWGGVIGIRGSLPFIDGGYLNRPEFANFGANGTWVLEGTGMSPDIEIDNHPDKEYNGIDEQLIKGIEVILEELKTDKKPKVPKVPEYPIKK